MATRLYTPSFALWFNPWSGSMTWDAAWAQIPTDTRRTQIASTYTNGQTPIGPFTESYAAAGPANIGIVQLLTHPLDVDQAIAGTLTGQLQARESNAAANAMTQVIAYVRQPDGSVRGVLYAGHSAALSSELATSYTNRTLPLLALAPVSLSSVNALAGDRIVIELGVRKLEAGTTSRTYGIRVGTDASSGDLPVDETTTTEFYRPWIEFSQDITFVADAPRIGSLALMGIGS